MGYPRRMIRSLAATVVAIGFLPVCARAGGDFNAIARGIGDAAQRAGVQKIQILPLVSTDGEATPEGRMASSRIMAEIIEQGKVLVVEGDLPGSIPDPYRTAMGIKAKANVRPEAEAVVTGSHISGGSKLHLHVQLLRMRDRIVLYSANEEVKNEWEAALFLAEHRPRPPQRREAVKAAVPPAGSGVNDAGMDEVELSNVGWDAPDAVADCRNAAVEVDRLQRSIMGIKARYVARKLKDSGRALADLPPSMIRNADLRSQFEMAVLHHLGSGDIPALTKRELRTFVAVDGRSFEIHHRCSVDRL